MRTILFSIALLLFSSYMAIGQSKMIDSLSREIEIRGADTNKVNAYRMLTGLVRLSDPAKAINFGKQGIALGKQLYFVRGLAGCYVNLSTAYIAASKLDSALTYIDTAIQYAQKLSDPNRLALVYLNRADIFMQLRNLNQSMKDCDTALVYAEQANNDDRRARINQTIGSVYYMQNKYKESIPYYEKAFGLYEKIGARQMSAIVMNNLGNVYKHLGLHDKSIPNFQQAVRIADSLGNLNNLSMYHGNLSNAYLAKGELPAAEQHLDRAMDYARQQNNEHQQAIAYAQFGELYLEQKKYKEAVTAARHSYEMMKAQEDLGWQQTAADLLAESYSKTGEFEKAFEFQKISKELNDTLVHRQFDEDIAAMQTTFKVNEKNREIQLLSKDGLIKEVQLSNQRNLLFTSIALLILTLAGIVLLINRNKLRQQMKELEIRNSIAADLHDEVGSSLSSIHLLSQIAKDQQGTPMNTGEILQRVSTNAYETMEKMSDIVWMVKPAGNEAQSLQMRMERFTYELCNARQIECTFSSGMRQDLTLSMPQKKNLYLIFKEALNNAVKYSGTKKLEVKVGLEQNHILLNIKDYGKGFDKEIIIKGNGLDNMQNRTKELKGVLEVASEPGYMEIGRASCRERV